MAPTQPPLGLVKTDRFTVLSIGNSGAVPKPSKSAAAEVQAKIASESKQKTKSKSQPSKKTSETKQEAEWTPTLQQNYERLLSIGEECITEEELKALILRSSSSGKPIRLYDGFEPSGRMHIAQGVFKAMNVNKATSSGAHFVFWVADWFALMNDKMSGDLSKIRTVGKYLIEVWKAAGMLRLHESVHFLWASEEITQKADMYWPLMLDVGRRFNITRIKKCCQIMGRLEGSLTAAQILYPLMQCTDVFFLKTDVCQLGVDQRKVNMLAREYADSEKKKVMKPVVLSHHMLYGLKQGQEKMSKSDPDSAIFMEDEKEDVERKIMAAYCPREVVDGDGGNESSMSLVKDELKNPCLDYVQHIIFSSPDATFTTSSKTYASFESVKKAFLSGEMPEEELKRGLVDELNKLLEPVRLHFKNDANAKNLLEQVQQFKKEAKTTTVQHQVRKLDLVGLKAVPQGAHVVFVPMPTTKPTLQMAMDVLGHVNSVGNETPMVLYLSDWSARVCGALDSDVKAIDAFYKVFVCALKALGLRGEGVTVVKQSEGILKDPSNYWISVINIGRFFGLNEVMGTQMKDSDGVGNVIARLMKVADALSLSPSSIAFPPSDINTDAQIEISLMDKYLSTIPQTGETKCRFIETSTPSLLLIERENEAHKMDTDEYYLLDDPKVHGKSKMKKSFCEPNNITFNPAINLVSLFSPTSNQIHISRSPENGGEVIYSSRTEIEVDFKSGALHPGDLKNAASAIMVSVLTKLSDEMKKNADASKASKVLKAFEKKMAKKVQQKKQ